MSSPIPHASFCEQGPPPFQEDLVYTDPELRLYIVCDGLGPQGTGQEACRIAVETIQRGIRSLLVQYENANFEEKSSRQALLAQIEALFQTASHAIFEKAKTNPSYAGMCSSIDLFCQVGGHALLSHVGAGRIYLLRAGEFHQLTEDHTQLAHYRRVGKLDTIPAAQHASLAKRITRAVGHQEEVKVDTLELELQAEDFLFICTDGIWQCFAEGDLEKILDPQNLTDSLETLRTTASTKTRDNFSALSLLPPIARQALAESSAEMKIKFTGKVPLFRWLSYQELIKVVSIAELFKVNAGATICKEGAKGGELTVILSGSASVTKSDKKIANLGKGDMFGEMSMLDTAPRSATITAIENCSLLAFPRDALFALLREEPSLSTKFLWGLSQELNKRLRSTSNKLVGSEAKAIPEHIGGNLPFIYSKEIQ